MSDEDPSEDAVAAFKSWIDAHEWTFAKTYADRSPHEYLHRDRADSDTMYEAFIAFIREHGYRERYGGSMYTCLDIGDHKYWTMGIPIWKTTIINRRSYTGYDILRIFHENGWDPDEYLDDPEQYELGQAYGAAIPPEA